MREPHENANLHLTAENIVLYIEGSAGEVETARAAVHLKACSSCFEVYQYARCFYGTGAAKPEGPAPNRKALRAAQGVTRGEYKRRNFDRRGVRSWLITIGAGGRLGLAAAVIVLFAGVVFWLRPLPNGADVERSPTFLAPVIQAVIDASERQTLVLPGVEGYLDQTPRSEKTDRLIENSLYRLREKYRAGNLSLKGTQWLIGGYLVTGQIDSARVYVDSASERFPETVNIVILEAALEHEADNRPQAEALLRLALKMDPGNMLARYNLGVVLSESGNLAGARTEWKRICSTGPNTPLAARAREKLRTI